MPDQVIKSVVVVGGGTAGWLTAGRIAAELQPNSNLETQLKVTLVESPNIATVGVGEGTWPTMRATLQALGISETEFIRECDGTFKQGAKFAKWVTGADDDFYYHPLMVPQGFPKVDLAPYWVAGDQQQQSFSNAVCFQEAICERGLAPKMITTPEFGSIANYSYHLDAGKFAEFLQKHCTAKLGVQHVLADVIEVVEDEHGYIQSLNTEQAGSISGDLFIDCTGFRSLLLGEHYKVPFKDRSDILQIDTALAMQVPYESDDSPIACHTISTGQTAGWIWDIGLSKRRGVGYVYSSRHISEDQAYQQLHDYVGPQAENLPSRKIPIRSGHRQQFWYKNCVAVGLAAGFLEPLEASAIVLVELSASMIAEQLPANRAVMPLVAKRFNEIFSYRWERIIDFLKLHYILSKRQEPFWRDMCREENIPDSLTELLELWRYSAPGNHDFTSNNEVFPAASYQYVLYGMGFRTEAQAMRRRLQNPAAASREFSNNTRITEQALAQLPTHRDLINKVHEHGFQTI